MRLDTVDLAKGFRFLPPVICAPTGMGFKRTRQLSVLVFGGSAHLQTVEVHGPACTQHGEQGPVGASEIVDIDDSVSISAYVDLHYTMASCSYACWRRTSILCTCQRES